MRNKNNFFKSSKTRLSQLLENKTHTYMKHLFDEVTPAYDNVEFKEVKKSRDDAWVHGCANEAVATATAGLGAEGPTRL